MQKFNQVQRMKQMIYLCKKIENQFNAAILMQFFVQNVVNKNILKV